MISLIDGENIEELANEHLLLAILQSLPPDKTAAILDLARHIKSQMPRAALSANRVMRPPLNGGGIVRPSGG